jgi:hypothetical protein
MMNDRFAAQLRQHLLDTADERPAHDQLATVVHGVLVTPQRRPFAARLTWNPGPRARYGLIVLALIGALAAVLLLGAGAGPSPVPPPSPVPTTTPAPEQTTSPVPGKPTLGPSPDPSSCTQFDHEAAYTAGAGTLPVRVTVPATTSSPWAGLPDEFELRNAPCGERGSLWINAALVANVYANSCHWKSSSVEALTTAGVVSQLQAQKGHDTSAATATQVGYFRATRLDLSVPADFDATTCDDGVLGLWEYPRCCTSEQGVTPIDMRNIDPGTTIQVYVTEVDSGTVVVTAGYHPEDATPDLLAEIDSMLASLRVEF